MQRRHEGAPPTRTERSRLWQACGANAGRSRKPRSVACTGTPHEGQLSARILAWRTAVLDPHECTHTFASA
eukprot:12406060-Alexandrium_andersonii.AAC.1